MSIDQMIYIFVPIIVVVGLVLLIIIAKVQPKRRLNTIWYAERWQTVQQQFMDGPSGQSLAVLNADKLLDTAMQQKGFPGKTMGERLKARPTSFSDINAVWRAHKLRNRIAHDHAQVGESECRQALSDMQKALRDLGAVL